MRRVRESLLVILALGLAGPARAQTAPVFTLDDYRSIAELFAGGFMQDLVRSGEEVPDLGIALSVAVYPGEVLGIAGEWSTTNHGQAALAGVKLRSRLINEPRSHWRLFGQVLAGPQWDDVGPQQHVIQIGAGADDYLRNGLVLHVEYDYRFAPGGRHDRPTGRYLIAIGIPLGSHDDGQSIRRSLNSSVGTRQRSLRPKTL